MTDIGFMCVFIGKRKNLRGAPRRTGNVVQTPRGFHYYNGQHWQLMDVPERIYAKEIHGNP